MYTIYLLILSSFDRNRLLPCFCYCGITLLWTRCTNSSSRPCFHFFGLHTQKWSCWIIYNSFFFWGTTMLFSTVALPFYIPTNTWSHSNEWGGNSLCFWFAFPSMINDVEHLFLCSLAICISSLENNLFKSFCPFLNQVVCLFVVEL